MNAPRRWLSFLGVGALGFAWQIAALDAMTRLAGVPYPVAAALAVELAILHNFVWHERWTWRDRRTHVLAARGESQPSHRDGRGARVARRDDREYREYLREKQRRHAGCIARRMQADFHHGLPGAALARLVRFNGASGLTSIAGNVSLTALFVEALGLPIVAANVGAVLVMSGANFIVTDRFVFRGTRRAGLLAVALVALLGTPGRAATSDLHADTVAAFDRYVQMTGARRSVETTDQARFLSVDFESPAHASALRSRIQRGEIVTTIVEPQGADGIEVPSGMIHHWRGYIFIAGVTVDDMLAAVRSPGAHRQRDVLAARVTRRWPGGHLLFLKLRRTGIVTVTYNTEHVVTYARDAQGRATSRSVSQRIAELEALESGQEREKPVGRDRGFLWRMNSYWRYEPVEDGVIVQLDSITLSRDLPWGIATIAEPIISRVARESVSRTLGALRHRFTGAIDE